MHIYVIYTQVHTYTYIYSHIHKHTHKQRFSDSCVSACVNLRMCICVHENAASDATGKYKDATGPTACAACPASSVSPAGLCCVCARTLGTSHVTARKQTASCARIHADGDAERRRRESILPLQRVCAAVADLSLFSFSLHLHLALSLFLSLSLSLSLSVCPIPFRTFAYVLLLNTHIFGLSQAAIRQRSALHSSSTPRWYGTPRPTRTRGRMRRAV